MGQLVCNLVPLPSTPGILGAAPSYHPLRGGGGDA